MRESHRRESAADRQARLQEALRLRRDLQAAPGGRAALTDEHAPVPEHGPVPRRSRALIRQLLAEDPRAAIVLSEILGPPPGLRSRTRDGGEQD